VKILSTKNGFATLAKVILALHKDKIKIFKYQLQTEGPEEYKGKKNHL